MCQNRDFFCQLDQLKNAFELLSNVVAGGDSLLHAHILEDNGQRMPLPLEAFDGAPFIAPIQQLEQQWLVSLNPMPESTPTSFDRQEIIQWNRIRQYETQIGSIQQTMNRFDDLQQWAQTYAVLNRKPFRAVAHFAAMRTRYEQQRSQARRWYQVALGLLARLTA
jgi:hypothetical protein